MLHRIGIIEIHSHPELIYCLASLAKYCDTDVTIFTTRVQYEKAVPFFNGDEGRYNWILQKERETLRSFLKRIEKHCNNKIDLLFLNMFYVLPHHQICYYLFRPQCIMVHMVGRIECLFGEWKPIDFRSVKLFLFSVLDNMSQFIRKRTLPMFDGMWVENKDAYDYAIARGYERPLVCSPFLSYKGTVQKQRYGDKLEFISIGSITSVRRDYKGLFDAFEKLFDSGRRDVTLTLLGAPVDEEGFQLIERCRKLVEKGLDITFYTEYIPEEVMNEKISSADIIIGPNDVAQYGTGTFGAIGKAMQFGKPGIYPLNSLHYEELISSSIFYNGIEELPGIIENLLDNPEKVREISQNAVSNSQRFSFETVADKFRETVLHRFLGDV